MPLVEMLETIRRLAMSKHKKNCRAVAGANGQFDVRENNVGHSVHMTRRTCTCRKWDMTGIPCRHALRVIMHM
ncbi:BnaAnng38470D [Brassica napus]|uniref:BnaAnng38470D protein n=1 Tax=Brassica napus TaxID=3708 RepID=A0A078JZ59_BRANA|nr:BnaAnng38470D [Brassica napus]